MAFKVEAKNGDPIEDTKATDVKIIVVGERKCGKTKLIEAFARRPGNVLGNHYPMEYARVYPCQCDVDAKSWTVKIFEIFGSPAQFVEMLVKDHYDANAIFFVYAIDDPVSFQRVIDTWIQILEQRQVWSDQPSILVGSKKDLRENQQVIQRLAQNNQAPVTYQEGRNLKEQKNIVKFFEVSSVDDGDIAINEAFHFAICRGSMHLEVDVGLI